MATQQEVIKNFITALSKTTLSGEAALDEAVKASSDFSGMQELREKMVGDCKSINNANTFLRDKCGIILNNLDTGAITGFDAGGSSIKTKENIVLESGDLKDFTDNTFTVKGLTFTLEKNFSELNNAEKFIWQGLYTWWADKALDLIEESYGLNFTSNNVFFKNVTVNFEDNASTSWLAWNHWYDNDSDGKVDNVTITINTHYYGNIDLTNPNGQSSSTDFYLDKTFAHELTHTLTYASIMNSYDLPLYFKEGLAELTIGIDDERDTSITYLAQNSTVLENNLNETSTNYAYASGYMLLRYLAKQASTRGQALSNITSQSLVGSANDDTLTNLAGNATVTGGNGNDSISNFDADNVTISAGNGADQIFVYGSKDSVNTGADDDYLYLYSNAYDATVTAPSGNNELHSAAQTALILAGNGDDYVYVYNNATNNTVDTGAGNDSIQSGGSNISISAGDGDDSIKLFTAATNTTVNAGKGDDLIDNRSSNGVLFIYNPSDGFDSVSGFKAKDTLQIGNGTSTYSSRTSGSDIILTVDDGNITLADAASLSAVNISGVKKTGNIITLTEGDDTYYNSTTNLIIDALGGSDSVTNRSANVSISAGDGNDNIYNDGASVTVDGGADNDSIQNFGSGVTVFGGAGNDTLYNDDKAVSVTLNGGDGNDRFSNFGSAVTIWGGAGNDSVYNDDDSTSATISLGAGNDSIRNLGENMLVQYSDGDGNDTISGFDETSTLSISGSSYTSAISGSNVFVEVGDGSILLLNAAGLSTLNILPPNNDKFITLTEGNDTYFTRSSTLGGATILGGAGDDSIYNGVAETVSIDAGAGKDTIYSRGSYSTLAGGDDADTITNNGGATSILGGAGDDSIYNGGYNSSISGGYGNDIIENRIGNAQIYGDDGDDRILNTSSNVTIFGGNGADSIEDHSASDSATLHGDAGNDTIKINGSNALVYGDAGNDLISLGSYSKNATINGGAGNDTIRLSNGGNFIVFASDAGSDTVIGFTAEDSLSISGASSSQKSGSDVIIAVGNASLTLKDAASLSTFNDTTLTITNSTKSPMTMGAAIEVADASARTTGINLTGNALNNSIIGGSGADKIYGKDGADYLSGGSGNDSLAGGNGKDTLYGGAGKDKLFGNDGADKMYGDADNDTLTGGSGNDTLYGGVGNDSLVGDSGNDKIYGNEGNDYLSGGSGNDSLAGGDGKDTLYGGTGKDKLFGNAGNDKLYGNDGNDTLNGGAGADSLAGGNGNDSLFGDSGNDKLFGNAGNDTLWGETGNDTLTGGDGMDTFIYKPNQGTDTILDYQSGELLQITNSTFSNAVFSANQLTLTIDGGGSVIFKNVTTSTEFNINNKTYYVSGSTIISG